MRNRWANACNQEVVRAAMKNMGARHELLRRMKQPPKPRDTVTRAAAEYARARIGRKGVEYAAVVLLDHDRHPTRTYLVGQGDQLNVTVPLNEVFHHALRHRASFIVLVHNHPSGDLRVSREDRRLTICALLMAQMLHIEVWDHVIVGPQGSRSVLETKFRLRETAQSIEKYVEYWLNRVA